MSNGLDFTEPDLPVGGYLIELEDRAGLQATQTEPKMMNFSDLPVSVDPRKSSLYANGWMASVSQLSIGACQGNALAACMEYCYPLVSGDKIEEFSRMHAYIASQIHDGIRGDSGSTLSGGTKAGREGICRESVGPYPSRYPGWGYITQAMKDDGKNYQIKSHSILKSADDVKQYIGSGIGIVQIGIAWNSTMTPDANGCIRSWRPGGGGHSVVIAGYAPDSEIGVQSSSGYWFLLLNSWGRSWGKNGWAYVDPRAVNQMIGHSWSTFIGRSDMGEPSSRDIDWTKESIFV
jgi:hypothetical protein